MNNKRPVYLNLFKIRLPIMGMVSFAHRITGVLLFLAVPFCVYLLHLSTVSSSSFSHMLQLLDTAIIKLFCSALIWSIVHHLYAGIRFLLIDADIGVEKIVAIRSAWSVVIIELATVASLFCWVWS